MAEELTVACVCVGDGQYKLEHVARLRAMVEEHLSLPHRFHVVTDESADPRLPGGWWQKVGLFRPGLFTGTVLYFDLDVTIEGSIDKLVVRNAPFTTIREFGKKPKNAPASYNTSVMCWQAGSKAERIYTKWPPPHGARYLFGDQDWICGVLRGKIQQYPLDWIVSYKYERHHPRGSAETCVRVYHGEPKPWNL